MKNVVITEGKKGLDKDKLLMMSMMGGMNGAMNPMMLMALKGDGMNLDGALDKFKPTQIDGGMDFEGNIVIDGTAIKLNEKKEAELVETYGMEVEVPLFTFPKQFAQLVKGDIVVVKKTPIVVLSTDLNKNEITGLNVNSGAICKRKFKKSAIGFDAVPTVVNMYGNVQGNEGFNPMMMMALMD